MNDFLFHGPDDNNNNTISKHPANITNTKMTATLTQRDFSPEQLAAGKGILNWYCEPKGFEPLTRYVLLVAQMQSGKTTVYYFVAAELLRLKKVQNMVIFSGNSEKELRLQIEGDAADKFFRMYARYLRNMSFQENDIEDLIDDIKLSLSVEWGAHQLSNYQGTSHNTAFIWDESHFAQNNSMKPAQFLTQNHIAGNGDSAVLEANGNYFLSVSATPFSEISDLEHLDQMKGIVRLEAGDAYHSVEKMMRNGTIIPFVDWKYTLEQEVKNAMYSQKYALVRVFNDAKKEEVEEIASKYGWNVLCYDSTTKKGDANKIECLKTQLARAPARNTIIVMKGMCRMGKVVEKTHLSFVMETSKNAKTDVILQGLLGRMCGYHNYTDVRVFLHTKFYESGNLEKYINFTKRVPVLPSTGNNLVNPRANRGELFPIIPVKIAKESLVIHGSADIEPDESNREHCIESVRAAFHNGSITNYNCIAQTDEIMEQVARMGSPETLVGVRIIGKHADGRDKKKYVGVAKKLHELFSSQTPGSLGSMNGVRPQGNEILIWWFQMAFPKFGIRKGDIFVDARTTVGNPEFVARQELVKRIPLTNHKEVFCRPYAEPVDILPAYENDSTAHSSNGMYPIHLSAETSIEIAAMRSAVIELVRISRHPHEHLIHTNRIVSNLPKESKFSGILVDRDVLAALTKGGVIFEDVKRVFGLKLKVVKKSGRIHKELAEIGLIPLMEISW